MSKVDAQRAMREARFEALEAQARATTAGRAGSGRAAPPTSDVAPTDAAPTEAGTSGRARGAAKRTSSSAKVAAGTSSEPSAEPGAVAEALCGHRSIGNKSCQRPAGHSEKNHRYK